MEGDRISPLESHRQPLEQVCCFPGVFSDGCDSSAQLLYQFHCSVVPGPDCLYGNWNEGCVAVGQLPVFGFFVRSGFVSCRPGRGRQLYYCIIVFFLFGRLLLQTSSALMSFGVVCLFTNVILSMYTSNKLK